MGGKEQKVQAMFSSIARRYDLNNSLLSLWQHHAWKRKAVELADFQDGMSALDLCAGTADLAILLGRRVRSRNGGTGRGTKSRVIALDLNERMLDLGRGKVAGEGLGRWVTCLRGNAEWIQFKDASFDRVTVAFGIRNVDNVPKALGEIRRVLKPAGRLVCLEFSRPVWGLLRRFYDFYSIRLLPWIGTAVSGDKTGVYEYLPDSIRQFPDQEGFKQLMRGAGFEKVEYLNLSGGIVAVHIGWC